MQAHHVGFERRVLPETTNMALDIFLGLLDDLFNPRGMNAPVLDQAFERELGDLAANTVEAGHDHDARGVVDDHVNARRLLERSNIATLAADDAPFHLVVGYIDGADRDFSGVRCGIALDGRGQNLTALLLAGVLKERMILENEITDLAFEVFFNTLEKHLARSSGESRLMRWSDSSCVARFCLTSA